MPAISGSGKVVSQGGDATLIEVQDYKHMVQFAAIFAQSLPRLQSQPQVQMASLLLLLATPFLVAADGNLRGFFDTTCTGKGTFPEGAPLCYGGQLLVQKFSIKVLSHTDSSGVVDMSMKGPTTAACAGAEFVSNNNAISITNENGCDLSDSEYTVKYCPDQDHFIINLVKPVEVEVVLNSQSCDEGEKEFVP